MIDINSFAEARAVVQPLSLRLLKQFGPLTAAMAFMSAGVSLLVVSGQDPDEVASTARAIAQGLPGAGE